MALKFSSLTLLVGILSLTTMPTSAMPAEKLADIASHLDEHLEVQTVTPIGKAVAYSHSKEYRETFAAACDEARLAIEQALTKSKSAGGRQNLAIVSDLDETLLDNRPFFDTCADKNEAQISWDAFEDWQKKSIADPLKPTRELLAYARSKGLAVFFVTGRMEHLRRATIQNLITHGIAYDGLYMRADGDEQSAVTMKSAYRKQIEAMGFHVVANIGDQYSDLAGGYSLDCEKLPNKIYFIR